jgi:hypothetical protein
MLTTAVIINSVALVFNLLAFWLFRRLERNGLAWFHWGLSIINAVFLAVLFL